MNPATIIYLNLNFNNNTIINIIYFEVSILRQFFGKLNVSFNVLFYKESKMIGNLITRTLTRGLTILSFFGILTSLKTEVLAQSIVLNEDINWSDNISYSESFEIDNQTQTKNLFYLYFEGASYPDSETQLPYYSFRKEITELSSIDSIVLENVKYEVIPWSSISNVRNLYKVGNKINVEHSILVDREIPYLHTEFVPIRKNSETGYFEKIVSFTLNIKLSEDKIVKKTTESYNLKSSSVLASGDWYKLKVKDDGIYKITYNDLSDLGITNFDQVRIFGNGEGQLPYNNNVSRIDDLEEVPIYKSFGSDGKLNSEGDYFLFFANGPHRWEFSESDSTWRRQLHHYSKHYYYFINVGSGTAKTIENAESITGDVTHVINDFISFSSHEAELENLFGSGRLWLGENFKYSLTEYDTTFVFKNIIKTKPVKLRSQLVSRSDATTTFSIYQNDNSLGKTNTFTSVNLDSHESYYARVASFNTSYLPESESQNIKFVYNKNGNCEGWLDYISLTAYCNLKMPDNYLDFRNVLGISENSIHQFNIANAASNMKVLDVTDLHDIKSIDPTISGSTLSFIANGSEISRYVIFNPNDNFASPEFETEKIENQNLHGTDAVDYVIVTLPEFLDQANELAEFHRTNSDYNVLVTTQEKVYNEFSSGTRDVSAIRDFMRFLYKKFGTDNEHSLKHLLLFGDGTYDNRPLEKNKNFIMTYQSANSTHQTDSYVGDDYFSFLDDNEGDSGGSMDIGVGRFPVRTTDQANLMLKKVKEYNSVKTFRPWRNRICFIGDDEDGNMHMDQANQLANKVNSLYPEFAVQKIFLDAYKQVTSADGAKYPDVTKSIYDALESGVLIMNYVGHGSEYGLAHERIIENQDISNWQNAPNYPLFMTATCEFSRFDDIETSAGENVLLNPHGGAIAMLTTTRVVYASQNFRLAQKFYDNVFQLTEKGERIRFGEILRLSKNAVSDDNKRNFTLLGDPACQLNFPSFKINTDTINDIAIENYSDTASAFSVVTVKGHIGDYSGNTMNDFNGTIYPSVYDKEQTINTLNNDGDGVFVFKNRPAPVFQGKASVINGRFKFTFVLPKDIAYNIGTGKIIYYAENDSLDAHGYYDEFYIGGKVKNSIADNTGPEISLFLNDTNFISGGISGNTPSIYAILKDDFGINTSSMGVGHDITIEIDNDKNNIFVANDYFETFQDDYTSGTINYPLGSLSPGTHTIVLKAWDINNNSSSASITFEVKDPNHFVINNLQNYPNPFSTGTNFTFEHNLLNEEMEITISIYSLTGELIQQLTETLYADGYKTPPIYWDGTSQGGQNVGRGMYVYKIIVKTSKGAISEKYNRLIIL